MHSNIIHQYFKKEFQGTKIMVRVNPIHFNGTELTVRENGVVEGRDLDFDQEIFDDLITDGFETASPMEFNLYLSGLV